MRRGGVIVKPTWIRPIHALKIFTHIQTTQWVYFIFRIVFSVGVS